ncbi:DUF3710 domain-containing protein [Thalassiella azotivora]
MSWFRRGSRNQAAANVDPEVGTGVEDAADEVEETDEQRAAREEAEELERAERALHARRAALADADASRRELGPLDAAEVDDEVTRVDLGALRLPPRQGMELRLELEEKTQRVVGVTVALAGSSVQMQAFAAPRRDGVWDDIRGEIAAQVARQGGTADEVPGTFGREVLARLPARTPDGRTGHQVARFTGVDGPRWFLRAVFHGKAAVDEEAARELEEVVRGTVVVRGDEAMAPRDLLPLRLPTQPGTVQPTAGAAAEQAEGGGQAGGEPGTGPLDPFRRGPEITETR